jgi:hypothetical protein
LFLRRPAAFVGILTPKPTGNHTLPARDAARVKVILLVSSTFADSG